MCPRWVLFPSARDCFEGWKKLTILAIVCACVRVCQISFLWDWCVMPFHPAMATGSRERLHSSCSGAHHWEDEKLPTEPPDFPASEKPPWAHTSHFCLPSQRKEEEGGGGFSRHYVPQHPNPLGCLSTQPGTSKTQRTLGLLLDEPVAGMQVGNAYGWLYPRSDALPSTCRCVSDEAAVDAGSGLLSGLSAFNCIWKKALKLEVMTHLLEA